MKLYNNQKVKGYTLIEVVVTIIVLGILTSLALPKLGSTIERGRAAEAMQILQAMLTAQRMYESENGAYLGGGTPEGACGWVELDVSFLNSDSFDCPIPVDGTGSVVATIDRDGDPGYTLEILDDGTIQCSGGSPANICQKLGCSSGVCN